MANPTQNPIYCAVDTIDLDHALALAHSLRGAVGGLKLGLEFFCANGPQGVRAVMDAADLPIFLDLKLHDIPNTVAGAIRAVLPLSPALITVHASGGPAMMEAAAEAAASLGGERPAIVAVSVLTSLDEGDLFNIGVVGDPEEQVIRLAKLAMDCGMDGLVCAAPEISLVRAAIGPDPILVVPGLRPAGGAIGDQKRVTTPREAFLRGADVLVIGRPITQALDPAGAAMDILSGLGTLD
jgi:orotidine-5'-phosphate decarboxylase